MGAGVHSPTRSLSCGQVQVLKCQLCSLSAQTGVIAIINSFGSSSVSWELGKIDKLPLLCSIDLGWEKTQPETKQTNQMPQVARLAA